MFKKGNKICIGRIPWNKGKKGLQKHSEEWKRKMSIATRGSKNHFWKGDSAGYSAIHKWVISHKGKPQICEFCGAKDKKISWANINHKYRRVLKDYIALCCSCHIKYDLRHNLKSDNKLGTNQYKKHNYKLKR